MIIDSRTIPLKKIIDTDICIVGAGVAGITVARELLEGPYRVCLVESGGFEPDRASQSLSWGENVGHPYYPLDTARARFFGGSSHFWHVPIGDHRLGVRLRPLDAIDFQTRLWVPDSGWPFGKEHLDPYYERAQGVCKIGPYAYDVDSWEDPRLTPRLPFVNGRVKTAMFQFCHRDVFFHEYKNQVAGADNTTILLYSNAVEIETNSSARRAAQIRMRCLNGNEFRVQSKQFILAAGGIEVPRLLLLSNAVQKEGLGNQHDLVGRYFMEHPHLWSGYYIPNSTNGTCSADLYKVHLHNDIPVMGKLSLSENTMQEERLLNYGVSLHPVLAPRSAGEKESKGVASCRALMASVRNGVVPEHLQEHVKNMVADIGGLSKKVFDKISRQRDVKMYRLNHMTEQSPNPESRVTLSEERDALGQYRARLDWKMNALDIRSMVRAQEIIDEELRKAGLGRLHIELSGEEPPMSIHGGYHHMGTTRMSRAPKKGVVDQNCKIHGISNAYIAGPSVFPTCGFANPVLTTVALALRLADHVKQQFT